MFSQLIEAIKNADIITIISIIITAAILFLVCMPTHEFAHAYAAYKLGDPTAKYQGRLTLNPLKHLDIFGFAMMLLLGFGYAKPVPVNMLYLKNRKRDMAIIAVAGPLMNFMTGVVFVFLSVLTNFIFSKIQINSEALFYIYLILDFTLETTAYISISLSIFNLIPIPPFDGSRILGAILPDRIYYKIMQYERFIFIGVLALLWFGFLDGPLHFMLVNVLNFLYGLFELIFGGFNGFSF